MNAPPLRKQPQLVRRLRIRLPGPARWLPEARPQTQLPVRPVV